VGLVRCPKVRGCPYLIGKNVLNACYDRLWAGSLSVLWSVVTMSASWSVHYQRRFHCNISYSRISCLKTTQTLEMTEIVYTYMQIIIFWMCWDIKPPSNVFMLRTTCTWCIQSSNRAAAALSQCEVWSAGEYSHATVEEWAYRHIAQ